MVKLWVSTSGYKTNPLTDAVDLRLYQLYPLQSLYGRYPHYGRLVDGSFKTTTTSLVMIIDDIISHYISLYFIISHDPILSPTMVGFAQHRCIFCRLVG